MPVTTKTLSATMLAGAFAVAIGSLASTSALASMEEAKAKTEMQMATGKFETCYGVALKGQNDCAMGAHSCAGLSTVDYDPASFKLVAKGTCTTMQTPKGMGHLEAM